MTRNLLSLIIFLPLLGATAILSIALFVVAMADPHDEIARLEASIERLSASAERCRKIAIAARAAIAAGSRRCGESCEPGLVVRATGEDLVRHRQRTPVHCDRVFMGRGSERVLTCWTPLGDVPVALGPIALRSALRSMKM